MTAISTDRQAGGNGIDLDRVLGVACGGDGVVLETSPGWMREYEHVLRLDRPCMLHRT